LKQRGVDLDIGRIPLDDKKTYELLGAATWSACSSESQGIRVRWSTCAPTGFEDLIPVALYRPVRW